MPVPSLAPPAERGAAAVPGRDPGARVGQAARQQLQLRQDRLHPAAAAEVGAVARVAARAVHGKVLRVPHLREEPGQSEHWEITAFMDGTHYKVNVCY